MQVAWLTNTVGTDLQPLFRGGLTRGGHGIGLASCTEIVAEAFGLDQGKAIESGYLFRDRSVALDVADPANPILPAARRLTPAAGSTRQERPHKLPPMAAGD